MKQLDPNVFYKLIENMNEAVWMGDENEKTIYASPKFCKLLEYKLEEIIGMESYIFWDKKSAEIVKKVNQNYRAKGVSSSYEGTLISKTGKKIPVLVSGTPIEGGTIGILTDLTEIKKKDTLYRNLVENMNEAVWMGNKEEQTLYANPKFCEITEYSLEEIIGKKSYEFWDEASKKRVKQENLEKRRKGISSSYEGTLISKSGKRIPVLLSGTPIEGGTVGIMTDLTELKKKEEKEQIFNNAIEYSTDAIIIFDKEGKIESWNKGGKVIFGYKKTEMIGNNIKTIFTPESLNQLLNFKKIVQNMEFFGIHKNKKEINISATLTPIFKKNKKSPEFFLLIARDITNKIKFEEELALKYQKMKEAYNKFGIIRRQMDYIFELLSTFKKEEDLNSMADFIVCSIIMLTRVDACVMRILNPKKSTLEMISSFGVGEDWKGKASIKLENSLTEKAFEQGIPLKVIDIAKEAKYQSVYLGKKNNLCSLLLIPLLFQEKLIGSLSLYTTPDKKLEIFENDFIEKYAKVIELIIGNMLLLKNKIFSERI